MFSACGEIVQGGVSVEGRSERVLSLAAATVDEGTETTVDERCNWTCSSLARI